MKNIVIKIVALIILLIGFYSLIKGINQKVNVIAINPALAIKGKVTGVNRARGYKIYLNNADVPYNLDRFSNEAVSKAEALGSYVDFDDEITKNTNTDTLILNRKGTKTIWIYKSNE